MIGWLAQSTTQPTANPLVGTLPFLLIMVGAVYFLAIRPQKRRAQQQRQLTENLRVGDEIMTSGGIFGTIKAIDEDEGIVTVEIAPGMSIRMVTRAISQRFVEDDEYEDEEPEEEEDHSP